MNYREKIILYCDFDDKLVKYSDFLKKKSVWSCFNLALEIMGGYKDCEDFRYIFEGAFLEALEEGILFTFLRQIADDQHKKRAYKVEKNRDELIFRYKNSVWKYSAFFNKNGYTDFSIIPYTEECKANKCQYVNLNKYFKNSYKASLEDIDKDNKDRKISFIINLIGASISLLTIGTLGIYFLR